MILCVSNLIQTVETIAVVPLLLMDILVHILWEQLLLIQLTELKQPFHWVSCFVFSFSKSSIESFQLQ